MKNSFHFCLSGYGYLEGFRHHQGKIAARVRVLQLPLEDADDEVVVNGEIDLPALLARLQRLERQRLAGHTVMIAFRVIYSRFGCCFAGMTPEDPEHMLELYGKLVAVKACYQDGELVPQAPALEPPSPSLEAA